ncbi:MAG: hypothetical protein UU08_C0001G0012 [Candidatus Uhrbacteria bacterium GW2011_GWE2_40_58]|nr:MAG: hypothetical protein UT94_C0001G0012 [Candidatus Uhrbacteria bacterium GW2011_GWF2_40_263]KKR68238.1 MAG: hypothetical protein UU08_C0001G0012 [Candidatus Uhrbacteria bacterium GW2011_GWE2_40_58]OGL97499.1 MAG: hypothetical protein A2332_00150 [Candidatus Uhrbacteria bacterium RIFOXYB2_FULL_41_18]HBK35114.1 hypothetical protein [Candidatus Uhrbacteria bacterium]HCB56245.1 hypothetical protein [Candidatus Uhrbacteria bacterium]
MESNLLSTLNQEQKEATSHKEGPLMIIAGAGTGKTMVITRRIAWLIEQGFAKPENILALTFTDKAAGEMEERVDQLLPYGYINLQISTFHAFCEKLLREYGVEIGLPRDFTLVNELEAWLLTRQNFDRFSLEYYRPLGNPTKHIRSLLTHFSRLKDGAVPSDDYLAFVEQQRANLDASISNNEATMEIARLDELAHAYHTYQQILLENDCLDFGDLHLYTLHLLTKRPNILKQIREQYTYLLVDEFQDTNQAQYELIKLIATPKNNLTIVGDDDQSIYKFRGASLANLLEFEKDYPEAKKIVLVKNYRSSQSILDHAYEFIQQNNPNRLEVQVKGGLCKKLQSASEKEGIIEHIHCSTLGEEASAVAQKILTLKQEDPEKTWNDFAILVRSNDGAIPFLQAMDRADIPYQFLALRGLYRKTVILDLLAYLRVLDNPFDSPSLYRVLAHEMYAIDMATLAQLGYEAQKQGKTLFEICQKIRMVPDISTQEAQRIEDIFSVFERLQTATRQSRGSEVYLQVIKETGYLSYLNEQSERSKQENFLYLQQFYERFRSFEARHDHPVLRNFLSEFAEELQAGEEGALSFDPDAGPELVKIMTIHSSKGLEFPFVFVVNLVDRRFPTSMKRDSIPVPEGLVKETISEGDWHLEEERRLFYVAMTRAKQGLFFTSAEDYGGARKRKLSRFLQELGYEVPSTKLQESISFLEREDHSKKQKRSEELVFTIPKRFSFTQLAAYQTCPLQYKFAHIFHIPLFGKWTYSYGKTLHNTLHAYFERWIERRDAGQTTVFVETSSEKKSSPYVSLEELLEMYKAHWEDEWYQNDHQREEYRKKGVESLRTYDHLLSQKVPYPLFLEQPFTLKIAGAVFKGRIDRIDRFEEGVEIIDYKTGSPKSEKQLTKEQKEQLYLYQLAARDVLGLTVKKLTYHYLEDHSTVSFLGTNDQLLDLEETMGKHLQAIREGRFDATPGFHCQFCDFQDICQYRQS